VSVTMKPWIWLRALSIVFVLFAAGHTVGVLTPPRGAPQAAVYATMAGVHFPAMGFDRTYGDYYRGFGLFVTLAFLLISAVAIQVGALSRRQPSLALPMTITLEAACIATAILSWQYFFWGPVVFSLAAVGCATIALIALVRTRRAPEGVGTLG
jgi:hypothetical protein